MLVPLRRSMTRSGRFDLGFAGRGVFLVFLECVCPMCPPRFRTLVFLFSCSLLSVFSALGPYIHYASVLLYYMQLQFITHHPREETDVLSTTCKPPSPKQR